MIDIRHVYQTFGDRHILKDVSLSIKEGETMVILECLAPEINAPKAHHRPFASYIRKSPCEWKGYGTAQRRGAE